MRHRRADILPQYPALSPISDAPPAFRLCIAFVSCLFPVSRLYILRLTCIARVSCISPLYYLCSACVLPFSACVLRFPCVLPLFRLRFTFPLACIFRFLYLFRLRLKCFSSVYRVIYLRCARFCLCAPRLPAFAFVLHDAPVFACDLHLALPGFACASSMRPVFRLCFVCAPFVTAVFPLCFVFPPL